MSFEDTVHERFKSQDCSVQSTLVFKTAGYSLFPTMKHCVVVLLAFLGLLALSSGAPRVENQSFLRRRLHLLKSHSTAGVPLAIHRNQSNVTLNRFHQTSVTPEDKAMWRKLVGEETSMSLVDGAADTCLPTNAVPFDTDGSIGTIKRKGSTERCGPNCYSLKGVNSKNVLCRNKIVDTADHAHFTYTTVSGSFMLISQVCGMSSGFSSQAGLMVRESLDPDAKSIFLSHSPNQFPSWHFRSMTCVWLALERLPSGDFVGYYLYDETEHGDGICSFADLFPPIAFNGYDFPSKVYVGMTVLKGKHEFNEIHFAVGEAPPETNL